MGADTFQAILVIYLFIAMFLWRRPLKAIAFFLFFRSTFSIAAYLGISGFFGGVPFFLPALSLLSCQAVCYLGKLRFNRVIGIYFLFVFLVSLLSAFFMLVGNFDTNAQELMKILFPICAYIMVYSGIREETDVDRFLNSLLWISLIPISVSLIEFASGGGFSYQTMSIIPDARPIGTIMDPNLYGIYLSLNLCLSLPLLLREPVKKKYIAYLLLVLFSIFVARNRGTWIALAVAFVMAVPLFKKHLRIGRWVSGAVLIAILGAPIVLAQFEDLGKVDQYGQSKDTGKGRFEYSVALLSKAWETPFIGNGAGSYDIGIRGMNNQVVPPHNDYVRLACEYGFFVTFLYILFMFLHLRWTIRNRNGRLWRYHFAACAAQIYLIIISVAQNVLTDATSFMLVLSMMAVSHRIALFENEAIQVGKKKLPLLPRKT